MFFFFFKQKTAYDMRISDWSSDVCSSDLSGGIGCAGRNRSFAHGQDRAGGAPALVDPDFENCHGTQDEWFRADGCNGAQSSRKRRCVSQPCTRNRSEEHTSELQSLMRISYAVFCLKKKK